MVKSLESGARLLGLIPGFATYLAAELVPCACFLTCKWGSCGGPTWGALVRLLMLIYMKCSQQAWHRVRVSKC